MYFIIGIYRVLVDCSVGFPRYVPMLFVFPSAIEMTLVDLHLRAFGGSR